MVLWNLCSPPPGERGRQHPEAIQSTMRRSALLLAVLCICSRSPAPAHGFLHIPNAPFSALAARGRAPALRATATGSVARWSMQAAAGSTRRGPRASSSGSEGGVGSSDPLPNINLGDTRTPEQIVEEGRELVREVIRVAMQTPPQMSFERTVALSRALLLTARDVAGQFQGRSIQDVTQEELEKELPRTLRLLFERLGPTYVKLGQFVASSPTLFPAPYVEEFQKCFDDVEKVPFNKIKSIVQAELGSRRIEDVFSYIDEAPLATASIAQVHAAKLAKTGEDVVIKVQKPGVGDLLQVDLSFLLLATKTLEFLNPELRRLSLGDIASDIRTSMIDELDFTKEAQNIDDFERFLSTSGIKNVVCPFVFKDASSKRLLTMTRLYGKPLTDLDAIREYASDPETTLVNALNAWTMSVVACKSFHADVHAGNLLVLENGKVAFIDFGIVGTISPKTWQAVEGLARGLAEQDYLTMAKAMVQLGATSDDVDIDSFARDLKGLITKVEQLDVDLLVTSQVEGDGVQSVSAQVLTDDQEVTRILLDLVALGQQYGIKFPRDFGLLLKQVLYFDRYTKLLAPTLEPLNDVRLRDSFDALGGNAPGEGGADWTDVDSRPL